MSHMTRMLLVQGIAAAKAGDKADARRYLERLFNLDPDPREKVEAWLYLSEVSDDPQDNRRYLEYVIGMEPWDPRARRGIAILNGDPRPGPTSWTLPARPPAAHAARGRPEPPLRLPPVRRPADLLCENDDLRCDYCGHRSALLEALDGVEEQEFVVALATAKGHREPVVTRAFDCGGCGAAFVAAPAVLSLTCPYCGSAHVLESRRELIEPEGIVPMAITAETARAAMLQWLAQHRLEDAHLGELSGLYLPVWTFDVGGEVRWRGQPARRQQPPSLWGSLAGPVEPGPRSAGACHLRRRRQRRRSHALPSQPSARRGFDLKQAQPTIPTTWPAGPPRFLHHRCADASMRRPLRAWGRERERVLAEIWKATTNPERLC